MSFADEKFSPRNSLNKQSFVCYRFKTGLSGAAKGRESCVRRNGRLGMRSTQRTSRAVGVVAQKRGTHGDRREETVSKAISNNYNLQYYLIILIYNIAG